MAGTPPLREPLHFEINVTITMAGSDALSRLISLLAPPTSKGAQHVEHAIALAVATLFAAQFIVTVRNKGLLRTITGSLLDAVRLVPGAAAAIDAGLDSALAELADDIAPPTTDALLALPLAGASCEALLSSARAAMAADCGEGSAFQRAAVFGGIYHSVTAHAGDAQAAAVAASLHALQCSISSLFLNTNALYPGLFRSTRRYEAEVVAMAVGMLKGQGLAVLDEQGAAQALPAPATDPASQACGLFTSGGTESVVLSVKAHRDGALDRLGYLRGGGGAGGGRTVLEAGVATAAAAGVVLEVVAGQTAHPALDKACSMLGLRLVKLPVHPQTQELQAQDVQAALTPRTILVYASAPGFAHGTMDPVGGVCTVAASYAYSPWGTQGVPVHVDNCLGGVLLSFLHAAGRAGIAPFDFRAHPAVSSISMDLHKYGCAPKGASVLAFRSPALRRYAYSTVPDYPGGLYTTPTLAGSRGGSAAAVTWHTMVHMGAAGYAALAARTATLHAAIVAKIQAIPTLKLLGLPHASVVGFTTAPGCGSPYALAARMQELGWEVPLLQSPPGCHIVVSERMGEEYESKSCTVLDAWLADLEACASACATHPYDPRYEGKGTAGIYGAATVLPAGEVGKILQRYCDTLYLVRKGQG